MPLSGHLDVLSNKHRVLERKLEQALSHPSTRNFELVNRLVKQPRQDGFSDDEDDDASGQFGPLAHAFMDVVSERLRRTNQLYQHNQYRLRAAERSLKHLNSLLELNGM